MHYFVHENDRPSSVCSLEGGCGVGYPDVPRFIGSIGRRMPACEDPIASHGNGIRIIAQVQGNHRRSTDRGQSFDPQAIVCPGKMFAPDLRARIEDRNSSTTRRINGIDFGTFVAIAERAGKPEVRLIVAATPGEWDDMLDLKACHHKVLWAEAIATAVTCSNANSVLNVSRNNGTCHSISLMVAASRDQPPPSVPGLCAPYRGDRRP